MGSHELTDGFFGGLVLNVCLEVGNEAFTTHIADYFLWRIEGSFVFVVLQQVLEDAAKHFWVNTNFCIIRVVLVDSEIIRSKEVEQALHVFGRQRELSFIRGITLKQTTIQIRDFTLNIDH